MKRFREENHFLVYLVNFSGLYLQSIEILIKKKYLLLFLTVWTKVTIVMLPIYIGSALKFLLFDEAPITVKMAVFRRFIAFSCFFMKIIFFYIFRKKIETLIDLWDSFFTEDFYTGIREERLMINRKRNLKILSLSWILTLTAGLIYTVPPFFSKSKTLSHPSGIPYRHESPDFELMVVFDFFRVNMGCLSAVSLDCILMVFLSLVLLQLTHLKESLSSMLDEISVTSQGQIIFASEPQQMEKEVEIAESFFHLNEIAYSRESLTNGKRFPDKGSENYEERMKEFEAKMRIWILHHQQVTRFFEEIKCLFSPVASIQLIYVVFYTCFTAFHLIRAKIGLDAFVIPFVASSNLVSLFVWCYLGAHIELVNSQLFSDAFGRSWHFYPKKIKKAFCLIILRGTRPLTLKGLSLFDINLLTFFQVFKITYQLFAFLLQVAREE